LYTCSAGSQVTDKLGVSPPTVHEYLYSVTHNILINMPRDGAEEEYDSYNYPIGFSFELSSVLFQAFLQWCQSAS